MPVVEVRNRRKRYRGKPAVADVSFTVEKGAIPGLLGNPEAVVLGELTTGLGPQVDAVALVPGLPVDTVASSVATRFFRGERRK